MDPNGVHYYSAGNYCYYVTTTTEDETVYIYFIMPENSSATLKVNYSSR